jgi:hypothetical protein
MYPYFTEGCTPRISFVAYLFIWVYRKQADYDRFLFTDVFVMEVRCITDQQIMIGSIEATILRPNQPIRSNISSFVI